MTEFLHHLGRRREHHACEVFALCCRFVGSEVRSGSFPSTWSTALGSIAQLLKQLPLQFSSTLAEHQATPLKPDRNPSKISSQESSQCPTIQFCCHGMECAICHQASLLVDHPRTMPPFPTSSSPSTSKMTLHSASSRQVLCFLTSSAIAYG